ncbi:MAG: hypothetical protein AB7E61_01135 [Acholeplasmataceae bacterium]
MRKNTKSYLRQIYQYDEMDKTYLIDVSLDNYKEIFNDWDAAPIKKKAMNPELETFLEDSSYDLPLKQKVKIVFAVPESIKDHQIEVQHIDAFKNYYRALIHFLNREMNINYRKMFIYIFLGFSLIVTSTLLSNVSTASLLLEILSQGVFVGGWVLLWESFSLFFFDMYDQRDKKKRYTRFINSKIIYRYIKK